MDPIIKAAIGILVIAFLFFIFMGDSILPAPTTTSTVDCIGSWGACSEECNGKQTYNIITPKQGNGKVCEAKDKDISDCNTCISIVAISDPSVKIDVSSNGHKHIAFNYTTDSVTTDNVRLTGQTEYTFTVSNSPLTNATVLIVGGGGGGGCMGGGGGGGDVSLNNITIPIGTHKIRVGNGGLGSTETYFSGSTGYNSSLILESGTMYEYCGGGGGGAFSIGATSGISNSYSSGGGGGGGGSGSDDDRMYDGGSGNGMSGNGGNSGNFNSLGTGGGGGATKNGISGTINGIVIINGDGGTGIMCDITGSDIGYGGGGGGGSIKDTSLPGLGVDGGGKGEFFYSRVIVPRAVAGTNGTGGGGGGGGYSSENSGLGANGGSGVVIIKYNNMKKKE